MIGCGASPHVGFHTIKSHLHCATPKNQGSQADQESMKAEAIGKMFSSMYLLSLINFFLLLGVI
jgi:hypothetical protein